MFKCPSAARMLGLLCLLLALGACAKKPDPPQEPPRHSFTVGNVSFSYRTPTGYAPQQTELLPEYRAAVEAFSSNMLRVQDLMLTTAPSEPPRLLVLSYFIPSVQKDCPQTGFQENIAPMLSAAFASKNRTKRKGASKSRLVFSPGQLLENTPERISMGMVMRTTGKNAKHAACIVSVLNMQRKILFVHQIIPITSQDDTQNTFTDFRQARDSLQLIAQRIAE